MKNIHILSTDKPSRLYLNTQEYIFEEECSLSTEECQNKHIYITSDEEIKKGDWVFQECLNMPHRLIKADTENVQVLNDLNKCKKIILTSDQDLINDGVQAIEDKFLEWFVKNPSCEEVKINHERVLWEDGKITHYTYKIIIPKEESILKCELCKRYPRLEGTNKCESCYSVVRHVLEQDPRFKDTLLPDLRKKEETLEEDAEKYSKNELSKLGFSNGAKWQAEKMYSEEEVGELLYNVIGEYGKHYGIMIDGKMLNDLFEQFKKK